MRKQHQKCSWLEGCVKWPLRACYFLACFLGGRTLRIHNCILLIMVYQIFSLLSFGVIQFPGQDMLDEMRFFTSPRSKKVTAIILTYIKHEKFSALLDSVLKQKQDNFELIIADSGCRPETQQVIENAFGQAKNQWLAHKYLQLCHNPGYAIGNNDAAKLADPASEWILLLNDDIVMQGESFVTDMLRLGEAKGRALGAVGCTLRTIDGEKLQEAGSIIWNDSSAAGFGRDREDVDAPEFNYPRPVDYISGACLMVRKAIFSAYGGFDSATFPNYYEDSDLQMHIQHDIKRHVWLQPKAVALHDEHGSFGASSHEKMKKASVIFNRKWKGPLSRHLENPHRLPEREMKTQFLKASDLRARDPSKARILWLDGNVPNRFGGSGYGRAFDNLSMLADLGHRVTVVSYNENTDDWCDAGCRDDVRQLGVELVLTPWEELLEERLGFYEIVFISRPTIFRLTHLKLRPFFRKSSFVIIYDCEALWYKRDESMLDLVGTGIEFPSMKEASLDIPTKQMQLKIEQRAEETLFNMADIVLAVAKNDEHAVSELAPGVRVETIGHVMNLETNYQGTKKKGFHQRNGILFIASFSGIMYYNGDAIWYFLKETYPLVLREASDPIPLTIAGRKIPEALIQYAKQKDLDRHITFLESPDDLDPLFESHRIFIAPHLYGAGIQFKLSEALSYGIPCVMSRFSADAFGLASDGDVTYVGYNPQSFKACILSVHGSENKWNELRDNGISFIRRTHSRRAVTETWSSVIENGKSKYKQMKAVEEEEDKSGAPGFITHNLFSRNLWTPTESCPEGEAAYIKMFPDVEEAVKEKIIDSAFVHWRDCGQQEGRNYLCNDTENVPEPILVKRKRQPDPPTKACPEGEEAYIKSAPDVGEAVEANIFDSAFAHWKAHGQQEGRYYICDDSDDDNEAVPESNLATSPQEPGPPTKACPEGEEAYIKLSPDVGEAVEAKIFDSAFAHWIAHGQQEGRSYICNNAEPTPIAEKLKPDATTKACPEGEEAYFKMFPDVEKAVKDNIFESGFAHWKAHGQREGKSYICNNTEDVSAPNIVTES